MHFINVNESIQVISYFDGQSLRPLRFRWRGCVYRVARINGIWNDIKGQTRNYHFHVSTRESGSFELIYQAGGLVWKIARVSVDG
ncbi:hypothetical protein JW992_00580 [candidate division KSB1 bacterium]|nr:hypothetical protein [candidate division KSB1 bacterium]